MGQGQGRNKHKTQHTQHHSQHTLTQHARLSVLALGPRAPLTMQEHSTLRPLTLPTAEVGRATRCLRRAPRARPWQHPRHLGTPRANKGAFEGAPTRESAKLWGELRSSQGGARGTIPTVDVTVGIFLRFAGPERTICIGLCLQKQRVTSPSL